MVNQWLIVFLQYMEREGHRVSRAEFEKNLLAKHKVATFSEDVGPLLIADVVFDLPMASEYLMNQLLPLIPGEPWQGRTLWFFLLHSLSGIIIVYVVALSYYIPDREWFKVRRFFYSLNITTGELSYFASSWYENQKMTETYLKKIDNDLSTSVWLF